MERHHFDAVESSVRQQFPLVFDAAAWSDRNDLFDELMIGWHDLPATARATIYFPGLNCEQVINLRNMRHAPADVRIKDTNTIEVVVGGVTYVPVPAWQNARIPALITIDLPDNVKRVSAGSSMSSSCAARNGARWGRSSWRSRSASPISLPATN